MKMTLEVVATGRTTATVILTQDQVDAIRGSAGMARVPVAISYKGAVYRTSVARYKGEWMMVVNAEMRDGGLAPGSGYAVVIEVDEQPRTVAVPEDLADALAAAGVAHAWESLSYTNRKEHVRSVSEAKKAETRQRRIESVVAGLSSSS